LLGGFSGFFLLYTKKRKRRRRKMAEVPTFKLVLVGDGGTGASFSFLATISTTRRRAMIFSFYASLSLFSSARSSRF
jgi:hypothetical protein